MPIMGGILSQRRNHRNGHSGNHGSRDEEIAELRSRVEALEDALLTGTGQVRESYAGIIETCDEMEARIRRPR